MVRVLPAGGASRRIGNKLPGSWRTLLAIYLGTLVVRAVTAIFVRQPGFTDSYYYYHVATNLYTGRGFVEDFIWNYLDAASTVTHASNAYWGPLASLLVLPSFWIFGPSFRAAQVPMVVISALLPVLTYVTARFLLDSRGNEQSARLDGRCSENDGFGRGGGQVTNRYDDAASHRIALIAAMLTIFSGVYLAYWTIPEGYVPFALAGAAALLAMARGLEGDWRWNAVAGASIAIAQLARSDGVLLLVVLTVVWVWQISKRWPVDLRAALINSPLSAMIAYGIVMAPWLFRNSVDFGTPLFNPGMQTLFLREYNDVFSYGKSLDLGYYFGWGLWAIARSKLVAIVSNLHVLAEAVSYYLAPLVLVGIWALRIHRRATPFLVYFAALFAAMTLAFTFPGPLGSLLHSVAALLPFLMTAAAVGLEHAVNALVRSRPHLSQQTASRLFGTVVVVAQVVLTVGLGAIAVGKWGDRYSYALYPEAVAWLQAKVQPGEPVMIIDPPAYSYFSGGSPAIVVPNDDPEQLMSVARIYGARYVVLEPALPKPLLGLYRGQAAFAGIDLQAELRNGRGQELKIYELR